MQIYTFFKRSVAYFSAHYCTITAHCNPKILLFPKKFASSSVVGYGTNELREGSTMLTAQFIDVGSESDVHISSFTPVIPAGESLYKGEILMQALDYRGKPQNVYTWDPKFSAWVDFYTGETIDRTFTAGDGLWVTAVDLSGFSLQTAGAVKKEERNIPLPVNKSIAVGHPFPTTIDIQDISCLNSTGIYKGEVVIQTLDYRGKCIEAYTFDPDLNGGKWIVFGSSDNMPATLPITSNVGLWVKAVEFGYSIQFPAPEM